MQKYEYGVMSSKFQLEADKQTEDLQKAVFYIQDEIQFLQEKQQEQ